jgi:hypothetical protein
VEVTRVWEVATTAEAARITPVLATETSTQEVTAELDSVATLVKDVEDRTALAEREAQERVSRVAAESTAALASGHEDVEGLAQKIALPEGELAEVRRAWELAEGNSCDLSDAAADAERWWEEFERERWE